MEFSDVIKKRFSCRKYKNIPVLKEDMDIILEAGRIAPTAKNLQEQRIYVVQSEEGLAKIDKITKCRFGAPAVLVVAFDRNNVFVYPGKKHSSGAEDASIVASHMMLAAENIGVGSCWVNYFDPEFAASELNLPENEEVLMMLTLGYPAEDAAPLPMHSDRKPLCETVTYL